jgi:hypothetical protein
MKQKVEDIISGNPTYNSYFNKPNPRVTIGLKVPKNAPLLKDIEKNHLAELWVEKKDDIVIIVVKVDLNARKDGR